VRAMGGPYRATWMVRLLASARRRHPSSVTGTRCPSLVSGSTKPTSGVGFFGYARVACPTGGVAEGAAGALAAAAEGAFSAAEGAAAEVAGAGDAVGALGAAGALHEVANRPQPPDASIAAK
jgi:hypothetical protein